MVVNRAGLIWMGRRADAPTDPEGPGAWWQMPQGGIDAGEDPAVAALRELKEETAISTVTLLGRTEGWLTYDLPNTLQGHAWKGRYRGQRQVWFAARFLGQDTEVCLDPPPGHEKEFDDWAWVARDQVIERVVSFKRGVYEAMLRQLGSYIRPL